MDVREKLVELLSDLDCNAEYCKDCEFARDIIGCIRKQKEIIAGRLIAHGVTVQEEAKMYWKPVNTGEWNLTCSACDSHLGCKENASFCPECGAKFVYPKAVMPQPPKGE